METRDTHISHVYGRDYRYFIRCDGIIGFSIIGDPMTELSDKDCSVELEALFGFPMDNQPLRIKKVMKKMTHKLGVCPIIA
jgi:hypothetical protein